MRRQKCIYLEMSNRFSILCEYTNNRRLRFRFITMHVLCLTAMVTQLFTFYIRFDRSARRYCIKVES